MEIGWILKGVEEEGLTALVVEEELDILTTRDRQFAEIFRAFSPKTVRLDISHYRLTGIPEDPSVISSLRNHIGRSVRDDCPPGANAFHLSKPILEKSNLRPYYDNLVYTVNFYKIEE